MTVYKVRIGIYTYWVNACESGWIYKERFFTTEEKAKEFAKPYIENHLWRDNHGQLVPTDDKYHFPSVRFETIELDDFSELTK